MESYLSREDILSLGWELSNHYSNCYYLGHHSLTKYGPTLIEIEDYGNVYTDKETFFRGHCPSVSELEVLMRQLNINKDGNTAS